MGLDMKMIIALLCSAILLISSNILGFAKGETSDNFDANKIGIFSSARWKLKEIELMTGSLQIVARKQSDMALSIQKGKTLFAKSKSVVHMFETFNDDFTVELDVNLHDGEHFIYLQKDEYYPPIATVVIKKGAVLVFNTDNRLTKYDADINYGEWTSLKIYVSPKNKFFSIYVDETLVVESAVLSANYKPNALVVATAATRTSTSIIIDNVKLYEGIPNGASLDEKGNLSGQLVIIKPTEKRTLIYEQDFSTASQKFSLARWSCDLVSDSTVTVENDVEGHTKVLKYSKRETITNEALTIILNLKEAVSENCTVEYYYMFDNTSKGSSLCYMFDSAGSVQSGPTVFTGASTSAFNGAATQALSAKLTAGIWYKVAIYAKFDTRTYDIYIDNMLIAGDLGFRNDASSDFKKLMLGAGNSNRATSGYIDDLKIYIGSPMLSEGDVLIQ